MKTLLSLLLLPWLATAATITPGYLSTTKPRTNDVVAWHGKWVVTNLLSVAGTNRIFTTNEVNGLALVQAQGVGATNVNNTSVNTAIGSKVSFDSTAGKAMQLANNAVIHYSATAVKTDLGGATISQPSLGTILISSNLNVGYDLSVGGTNIFDGITNIIPQRAFPSVTIGDYIWGSGYLDWVQGGDATNRLLTWNGDADWDSIVYWRMMDVVITNLTALAGSYRGNGSGLSNVYSASSAGWTNTANTNYTMNRVGIRTNTPQAALHVHGDSAGNVLKLSTLERTNLFSVATNGVLDLYSGNLFSLVAVANSAYMKLDGTTFLSADGSSITVPSATVILGSSYPSQLSIVNSGSDIVTIKQTDNGAGANLRVTGGLHIEGTNYFAGNAYFLNEISASNVTDRSRSPATLEDAMAIVQSHDTKDGTVDHTKLSPLAYGTKPVLVLTGKKLTNAIPEEVFKDERGVVTNTIPAHFEVTDEQKVENVTDASRRNLSMVISAQAMVIKDLLARVAKLEGK
jgi:hypothetical protein